VCPSFSFIRAVSTQRRMNEWDLAISSVSELFLYQSGFNLCHLNRVTAYQSVSELFLYQSGFNATC